MNRVERAVSCFQKGFSCSEALLSTYGPLYGLDEETAFKVARAFGGGMGRMGETCGAVTSAFMVLGLMHDNPNPETKEKVYAAVREFTTQFNARHGSICCRELLGLDLSTAEGLKRFKELRLIASHCPKFVRDAAEIVESLAAGKDPG